MRYAAPHDHDLKVGLMAASEEGYARNGALSRSALAGRTARPNPSAPFTVWTAFLPTSSISSFARDGSPASPQRLSVQSGGPGSVAKAIIAGHSALELAIGRNFPLFRRAAADRIIHRISRENALFPLVTALPNVIPSVIDLPWAVGEFATDTAFLTMNQIRMALLMAALYGHTVGYGEQKAQIAVIAASAFGWRALARELVGKIPLGGGLIPKAGLWRFAGTYVVGLGLDK